MNKIAILVTFLNSTILFVQERSIPSMPEIVSDGGIEYYLNDKLMSDGREISTNEFFKKYEQFQVLNYVISENSENSDKRSKLSFKSIW